jgi:hypothetical protein
VRKIVGAFALIGLLWATLSLCSAESGNIIIRTGWITDSTCAATGANTDHKDCAVKCARDKSAKWVFVNSDANRVLSIRNEDAVNPNSSLGHQVTVTGQLTENDSIHINSIVPAASQL